MNRQDTNPQEINQILMQFGPLHGNVEKQEIHTPPAPTSQHPQEPAVAEKEYESPIYLAKEPRGFKIDLIRVINVLYMLGFFTGKDGKKVTKKEVFIAIGKAVNLDLSSYDSDLSRSLSDSTALEKHLSIFDRMKDKMKEVFRNYGEK